MDEKVAIRWLIRRDMDEVLAIERESFDDPYSEDDMLEFLRQRNSIGSVIEVDYNIVGFMLYELYRDRLVIRDIAISSEHRLKGYGRRLVDRLIDKLSLDRRRTLEAAVRETNLDAQLFFSSSRLKATEIVSNHFDTSDETAYMFKHVYTPPSPEVQEMDDQTIEK